MCKYPQSWKEEEKGLLNDYSHCQCPFFTLYFHGYKEHINKDFLPFMVLIQGTQQKLDIYVKMCIQNVVFIRFLPIRFGTVEPKKPIIWYMTWHLYDFNVRTFTLALHTSLQTQFWA